MVTYGDMMTLVLCFFVVLVAISEIKKDRLQIVVQSLRKAFGYEEATFPAPGDIRKFNSAVYEEIVMRDWMAPGGSIEETVVGKKYLTTTVKDGLKIILGGRFGFEEGSADLSEHAAGQLADLAALVKGYPHWLEVRGHCSRSRNDVPAGTRGPDAKRDLSWRRARAVTRELASLGIKLKRIRTTAVADNDPLRPVELTKAHEQANRRIEVIVSEEVIKDQN